MRLPGIRLVALLGAFACGPAAPAAPVPRERVLPDDRAIKKRFYACWREAWVEKRAPDGKVTRLTRPSQLSAYDFGEKGGCVGEWSGELSPIWWYPVKLDTMRTPMWFETIATDKNGNPAHVIAGIFKFDGPRLVLAYGYPAPGWRKPNPTDFEPRPGVVISVLERCEYLEQYSAPERVP